MSKKMIVEWDEYKGIVEKLAIEIHKKYDPTVLVGIMRGAAPIIDILSRILKLPIAYIVIQSYSGKGMEDKQGQLMFAREISSLAENKDYNKVLLVDDLLAIVVSISFAAPIFTTIFSIFEYKLIQ